LPILFTAAVSHALFSNFNWFARRTDFPKSCQAHFEKIFFLRFPEEYDCLRPSRASSEGVSRSSRNVVRDAMDVLARATSAANAYGKTVWSWSPDAGIKLAGWRCRPWRARHAAQATVAIKARTPGRARD